MKSIAADLVLQRLDRAASGALNRRLYDCLRYAILDRALAPESALPASRDLAQEIGVSRNTVLHAYAQLQAEGYVEARVGSGTFVAATTPDSQLSSAPAPTEMQRPDAEPVLACRAQRLLAQASAAPRQWGAFMPGVPDVTQFPHQAWSRNQTRLWRAPPPELLSYGHGGGLLQLRQAIGRTSARGALRAL